MPSSLLQKFRARTIPVRACRAMRAEDVSGDDIGGQAVFDLGNQILQPQFAFFQPLQGQLICRVPVRQGPDRLVQIAVFAAEHFKFHTQHIVVFHGKISRRIHRSGDSITVEYPNIGRALVHA